MNRQLVLDLFDDDILTVDQDENIPRPEVRRIRPALIYEPLDCWRIVLSPALRLLILFMPLLAVSLFSFFANPIFPMPPLSAHVRD